MTMTEPDRAELDALRGLTTVRRDYAVSGIEVRAVDEPDSTVVNFYGHASVTGKPYEMYGGPTKGGWNETVTPGAFKRTLGRKPDVAFLVNHDGMTLARTKAGTLKLREDDIGLEVKAQLDTRVSVVNDLVVLMEAGNMDEMSFAFRVTAQRWLTKDGDEVPYWDMAGIERHIDAVDIEKGDVSAVNYGANPFTDAALRAAAMRALDDEALLELVKLRGITLAPSEPPAAAAVPTAHPDVAARLLACDMRRPTLRLL